MQETTKIMTNRQLIKGPFPHIGGKGHLDWGCGEEVGR